MDVARRTMLLLLLGIAGIGPGGCNPGSSYEHAKVHGKVTYRGKPVTFGSVLFIPVEAPKEGTMQPASGSINPDGTYELASQTTAGAILGDHKVLVIAVEGGKPAEAPAASKDGETAPLPAKGTKDAQFKSAIPKKYSDPTTTPLVRKVVAGDNTIDIELPD